MNRNERTPRTLADTVYCTGYAIHEMHKPRTKLADVALATLIGVALAAALVYGWSI